MARDVKSVCDAEEDGETLASLLHLNLDTLIVPQNYNQLISPRSPISRSLGSDALTSLRPKQNLMQDLRSLNVPQNDLRKFILERSKRSESYGGEPSPRCESIEDSSSDCDVSDIENDSFNDFTTLQLPRYLRNTRAKYSTISNSLAPILTVNDWATYYQWVKQVAKSNLYENEVFGNAPSLRQIIFLHFIKLEIPVVEIVKDKFGTVVDWKQQGRIPYSDAVSFLQVPLADDFSSTWWCSDYPIPNGNFGHSYICHYLQTFPEEKKRTKREKLSQAKKVFYKEMLNEITNPLFENLDPKHAKERNMHINWAIKWVISPKKSITNKLRIDCSKLLLSLLYPEEKIEGLSNKLWESGAAFTILQFARSGQLKLHTDVQIDQIRLGNIIDRGSTGKVYSGVLKGKEIAVKLTEDSNVSFRIEEFRFEVAVMTLLKHPNIASCRGANLTGPKYALVTDYQARGSLRSVLVNQKEDLSWKNKIHILYNIAKGMEYVHRNRIIHRDLKTPNILIGGDWSVRITDFGSSCIFGDQLNEKGELIGTTEWMAPEIIAGKQYDEKVDVYSFGITMCEVMSREIPYSDKKTWQIPDLVLAKHRPNFPSDCPYALLKDLTQSCWHHTPKKRPTFSVIKEKLEFLSHKLFKMDPEFLLWLQDPPLRITEKTRSECDRKNLTQSTCSPRLKLSL